MKWSAELQVGNGGVISRHGLLRQNLGCLRQKMGDSLFLIFVVDVKMQSDRSADDWLLGVQFSHDFAFIFIFLKKKKREVFCMVMSSSSY